MKNFSNLAQAEQAILELKTEKWKYKFEYYNLYVLPENNFLGVFNRLHIGQSTFNFSNINENSITQTLAPTLDALEILNPTQKKLTIKGDFCYNQLIENALSIESLFAVIQEVFSNDFLFKQNFSEQELEETLEQLKNKPVENSTNTSQFHNFRMEEIREDLRIILMINPKTLELKLCYSYWERIHFDVLKRGITSPVQDFYYYFFNGLHSFWSYVSKNTVNLLRNDVYNPYLNSNCNQEAFSIKFHTSGMRKSTPFGIAISSGKAQMKFLNKLLLFLHINFGDDDFKLNEINKETECFTEKIEDVDGKRKKLIYYQGIRAFSTPQFDIYLNFGPVILQNQLYFQCRVDVFPFVNLPDSEKINNGWREHPMVEFWEVK
jgi:hypothetical protein